MVGLAMLGKMAKESVQVKNKGGRWGREHKGDVLRGTAETFTGEVDKVMGWGVNARVHMVGEGDQREKVRIRILAKLGQVLAGPGRACWKFGLWWGAVGGGGGKEVVEKIWGEGKDAAR